MEPCFSMRLVQPFLQCMEKRSQLRAACSFANLSVDAQVPAPLALCWIESAVQALGNADLGLHAAEHIEPGSYDLVEYAARSCGTWGEALNVVLRYVHLLNEAADYALQRDGRSARLELRSTVPLPRAAADFTVCGLVAAASRWTAAGSLSAGELWFRHARPASTRAYEERFGPIALRFGAPFDALVFDEALLSVPLRTADPNLNALLRRHADHELSASSERRSFSGRVRALLLEVLPSGSGQVEHVARKLGMSRRTLARQLEQEGTTYEHLLKEARHGLALWYLPRADLSVQDVAFLLGYADTTAFSRAFRRWTGQSPVEFRRAEGARLAKAAG